MEHTDRLLLRYGKRKCRQRPSFFVLSTQARNFEVKRVAITQPFVLSDQDLALHYSDGIIEFERQPRPRSFEPTRIASRRQGFRRLLHEFGLGTLISIA